MAHKAYGLLYQVIVSLGTPFRILAFDGPFKESASDVGIFQGSTLRRLLDGERVMCDKAYVSEAKCWTPPLGSMNQLSPIQKEQRRKVTRIRHLNERLIGRLTYWGLFKKKWHFDPGFHKTCANVCASLTQLELLYSPLS
jgi:hypothetical protein